MTMGKTALHRQRLAADRGHSLAAQHAAQSLDLCLWPIRKIGERALADLIAVTIALPEQDRRWRVAVRNALDVHGELESQVIRYCNKKIKLHGYKIVPKTRLRKYYQLLRLKKPRNFGLDFHPCRSSAPVDGCNSDPPA